MSNGPPASAATATTAMVSLPELLSACIDMAERAGAIVRGVFESGQLQAVEKERHGNAAENAAFPADLQTEADRRAESLIVASLKKAFPSVTVVGEESSSGCEVDMSAAVTPALDRVQNHWKPEVESRMAANRLVVWVDPLDGTHEYACGNVAAVTTLIGLSLDGLAFGGVIHCPFAKPPRTLWGLVGLGVFGIENPKAGTVPPDPVRPVVATSRSKRHARVVKLMETPPMTQATELRIGGSGSKGLALLEGSADAWLTTNGNSQRWDICATEALLKAQGHGGMVTDAAGKPYLYESPELSKDPKPTVNRRGVVASRSREVHDILIKCIADHLAPYPHDVA